MLASLRKHPTSVGLHWFVPVAALMVGCTDQPSTPVAALEADVPPAYYAAATAPRPEFESRARFDLEVEATGPFKPGHPIHLTLKAKANFATEDGEVRLTLPEVAAAEDGGWSEVVVMPTDGESRPHVRVRKQFAPGDAVREKAVLTVPEPGYYYMIATGYSHPTSDLAPIVAGDVSRRDYWLWIDERGGRVTETFDTTLFSPGERKQPGPRGSERKAPRTRRGDANITCSIIPTSISGETDTTTVFLLSGCPPPPDTSLWVGNPPPPPPSATATFKIVYTHTAAGAGDRPVPSAYYRYSITSAANNVLVRSGTGVAGADGGTGSIDCGGATNERRIYLEVYTLDSRANVKYNGSELAKTYSALCGGHTDVRIDPEMAHLFLNAVQTYEGHKMHLPLYPERIYAALYDDGKTYYDHNSSNGEAHVAKRAQMVYGEHGVMVIAHEWGHRFQDRKLYQSPATNGLMRFTSGCLELHPPESGSSFGCAMGEAFADWYAVVVRRGDLPTWYNQMETNNYYRNCVNGWDPIRGQITCTTDGSIVQGAVAAMLWDISDVGSGESHDRIDRNPGVVVDALRYCYVTVNGSSVSYDGVDHLIWCLENRSPYAVKVRNPQTGRDTTVQLFNTRAANRLATATSGTKVLANSDDFRRLWLVNLYSKRPEVGTSPSLAFSIEPEEPAPGPSPAQPGCGTMRECVEMY